MARTRNVDQRIEVEFADGCRLVGYGTQTVERGRLYADGPHTLERGDILYLEFSKNPLVTYPDGRQTHITKGAYVICRGGLYRRVLLP